MIASDFETTCPMIFVNAGSIPVGMPVGGGTATYLRLVVFCCKNTDVERFAN